MYKIKTKKTGILLVLFILNFTYSAFSQIREASIGVDGLTCSQCSRSVEMELRKLDFVKDVKMNLENTSAIITFKNSHAAIPFEKIATAVKDAGFSLRYLKLQIANSAEEKCIKISGEDFLIDKVSDNGEYKIVGKGFMPAAEWKKYPTPTGSCTAKRFYYLTPFK